MNELDQLAKTNAQRVQAIEERYNFKNQSIKPYIQIIRDQKVEWQTEIVNVESVESYPTYGRGIEPPMNMDTFMIQEAVIARKKGEREPTKQEKLAVLRRRILSPKRKRFES